MRVQSVSSAVRARAWQAAISACTTRTASCSCAERGPSGPPRRGESGVAVSEVTNDGLFARAGDVIPGGVNSPVRAMKGVGMPHPLFIERARGAHVWDADGNRFVDLGGGRMEADQVNAIRHLVANAVQGLQPDQVAVVDNRGRVLSEELRQDPTLGTASSQMRYKQQVEDYLSRKVETMLAAVNISGKYWVKNVVGLSTDRGVGLIVPTTSSL